MDARRFCFWFEEISKDHTHTVGKKCANLGEMTRMGLPVPPGFAVSIAAYSRSIEETGAGRDMAQYVQALGEVRGRGIEIFEEMGRALKEMIEGREMPSYLKDEIEAYYGALCRRTGIEDVPVSVRSAGVESRPGMFDTYLNVSGIEEVLEKVKKVWTSAYTPRAIAFRVNKNLPILSDELGVAIVKMVNARSAGVAFTVEPVSGDTSKIIIEANFGLGEGVVSGEEGVDRFIVDKETLEVVEEHVGKKTRYVVARKKGVEWEEVPAEKQVEACLSKEEVTEVARVARLLEERLGCPQDVEWAIEADLPFPQNIFLLQTRPAKAVKGSTFEALAQRMSTIHREIRIDKAQLKEIQFKF